MLRKVAYRSMKPEPVPAGTKPTSFASWRETLDNWVNACRGYCGPAPDEAPPSPRSSRLLPYRGGRQSTGWPNRAIARWGLTNHTPSSQDYSIGRHAVGRGTAIAAASGSRPRRGASARRLSRSQCPQLPQNGNWPRDATRSLQRAATEWLFPPQGVSGAKIRVAESGN